jgi:prepilin-type N-terminal cleavage/methylation domain-containing protein/prepilin-type processing-associated H-X9-DG protein
MRSHSHNLFTLIEMLVVIVILAILVALLMPSMNRAKERSFGVSCMSNMRQIGQAYTLYTRTHDFNLPGSDTGRSRADWVQRGDSPNSIKRGTLWEFVGELGAYRCPKDFRWDRFKKVRSDFFWRAFSINGFLNGERKRRRQGVTKWTKVENSFDQVFVIVEEQDPRGYNMNSFYLRDPPGVLRTWRNADWMAPLHLRGYNITFLDGHIEYIKTTNPRSLYAAMHKGVRVPNSNLDRRKLWDFHFAK